MPVEQNLLFAVLAFENDLLDLSQLTAACRAWAEDKSRSLADLLVQRGWITPADHEFIDKLVERKLAKHHHDPRVTLNALARGDVCDAIKTVEDSDIQQSVSSWPSSGTDPMETIGETQTETERPKARYTWLNEVGKGGLGRVWLARDNDMSREVALKEIRLEKSSESQQSVRRLIKEAQITGQLQHPNIVPVYELHRGHRPFYTMKLVKGETLAKAIQRFHNPNQNTPQQALISLPQLLNNFISMCEALAYAHSRGIIHRDLKPENIVLGDFGEVVVLDWGLAKHIGSPDEATAPILFTEDAHSAVTHLGATPGTPAYMAPEQASGRVDLIDHRTDVYGLGAILFEILTGQSPHRDLVSRQRVVPPTKRQTREDETAPESGIADSISESPSREKRNTDSLAAILHRVANAETPRPRVLNSQIAVELDAICATAMSKRRDDRYQNAKALIADVRCFLFDEPVSVISSPLRSRTRRLVKRHQLAVASTAAALIIGLASLGGYSALIAGKNKSLADLNSSLANANTKLGSKNTELEQANQRERQATLLAEKNADDAKDQEMRAEQNAADAKTNAKRAEDNAARAELNAMKAEQNAAAARKNADEARTNADQARQQSQLALKTLESVIFDIQRGLKDVPGAGGVQRKLLTTALERLTQISDQFVAKGTLDRDTAVALIDLGDLFLRIGSNSSANSTDFLDKGSTGRESIEGTVAAARKLYSQALKINQELAAAQPNDVRAKRDVSVSFNKLGNTLLQSGQVELAAEHHQNGLDIIQKLAIANPNDFQLLRDLSISYQQLGDGLLRSGKVTEAIDLYRKGQDAARRVALNTPDDLTTQNDLCSSCGRLGNALLQFGQPADALEHIQKGLVIGQKLADGDPNDAKIQRTLCVAFNNLGDARKQLGQLGLAFESYQKGLEVGEKLRAADATDVQAQRHLSISYSRLGDISLQSGKLSEALGHYQKFQEMSQKFATADPSDTRAQRDLWASQNNLGSVLLKSEKATEAIKHFEQGMAICQKLAIADPDDPQTKRDRSISHNYLGDALIRIGKSSEAIEQYRQGLEIRQLLTAANPNDVQTRLDLVVTYSKLGDATQQSKAFSDAVTWYEKALDVLTRLEDEKRLPPANQKWIPILNESLAKCQQAKPNRQLPVPHQ